MRSQELREGFKENEIFLEIGTGISPSFGAEGSESTHLAMDKNFIHAKIAKDISLSRGSTGHYINADGERIPLANDSVKTIVMKDVLGEPPFQGEAKKLLLEEVVRALKADGIIVVMETATPMFLETIGDKRDYKAFIQNNLNQAGLNTIIHSPGNAKWGELMKKYIGQKAYGPDSFIITATKRVKS